MIKRVETNKNQPKTFRFPYLSAKGLDKPKEYMYMYSKDGEDYFKNINFRNYVSFQYDGQFLSCWNLNNIKQ